MEESATKSGWLQHAVRNGIILGVIHLIIFVILYAVFPSKLTGFSYLFATLVINFAFVIYQGIQYRKQIGGFMEYGEAFKYTFAILLVNGIIGFIFNFIFVLAVPDLPELMAQSQLDTSVYWAQKLGAPEEALDKMREDFNPEEVTKRFAASGMLIGLGVGVILYAIGAAIMSFFVRKNQPVTF